MTAPESSREILAAMLTEHRPELLGFVRRRAGHLVDPEDVLQEAAGRALAAVAELREPSRARAWFFRILRNALTDELRKLGLPVPPPALAEELPAPTADEPGDCCSCALTLAGSLKPEYASILQRVIVEETPVTTLAGELGLTPNNATVRLHRARQALRDALLAHCGTRSTRACIDCVCEERGCCALG